MKSDLWKKGIVLAIISLFIGASVIPSIPGNLMDANQIQSANSDSSNIRTALVLHTVEWQADEITSDMPIIKEDVDGAILRCFLQCAGYNVVYKENEEVDLNYIKNNLSADFIEGFEKPSFISPTLLFRVILRKIYFSCCFSACLSGFLPCYFLIF